MIISINFYNVVDSGKVIYEVIGGWEKIIGIGLKISSIEAAFLILSTFLFTVILIYIQKNKDHDFKFLFFILLLQGSFNGFVVSDDIFNIFVMLELITIISTILIIYKKDAHSLKAGIYYLLFNSVGMMFFLIGIIILYIKFGTLNLTYIKEVIQPGCFDNSLKLAIIFFISAFGVKSAVFPVYDWLPKAHSASLTSISALLSGLLVKTGVIGLMKITRVFDCANYSEVFLYLGIATAFLGVIFAFSQKDIKQILSFHTVSQIGLIMIGFSINIDIAMIYLINHSVIKSLLFLTTGIIINKYGDRRVNKIRGLWHNSKYLSIVLIIAALSLAGLPFTSGFISKSILGTSIHGFTFILVVSINSFTFASMMKILSILKGTDDRKFEVNKRKYFSLGILVSVIFIMGIAYIDFDASIFSGLQYLKVKNLLKFMTEFAIGMFLFMKYGRNELKIMNKLRHFTVPFYDGVILLVSFILILIYIF
ncbi:MAG: hypothetical protein JW702_00100 [Clostridiales bacterium]|nr:hypothetical protein [Clostridiales bacterium]